jgi:hypothetical protein
MPSQVESESVNYGDSLQRRQRRHPYSPCRCVRTEIQFGSLQIQENSRISLLRKSSLFGLISVVYHTLMILLLLPEADNDTSPTGFFCGRQNFVLKLTLTFYSVRGGRVSKKLGITYN